MGKSNLCTLRNISGIINSKTIRDTDLMKICRQYAMSMDNDKMAILK